MCWSNDERRHSSIGYRPPVEYEQLLQTDQAAEAQAAWFSTTLRRSQGDSLDAPFSPPWVAIQANRTGWLEFFTKVY